MHEKKGSEMTRQGFMSLLSAKVNEHSLTLQGEIERKYLCA